MLWERRYLNLVAVTHNTSFEKIRRKAGPDYFTQFHLSRVNESICHYLTVIFVFPMAVSFGDSCGAREYAFAYVNDAGLEPAKPPACRAGALPTELIVLVATAGVEPAAFEL